MRNVLVAGAAALTLSVLSTAPANAVQPDDHAPIGVMGDHLHAKGSWMVGYHYEQSRTSGYRNGASKVSNASVMAAYGEAATKMDMSMHMLELMYGVTDDFSLMLMPQYMYMDMTHKSSHGGGHSHEHSVEGLGDTELTGLYSIFKQQNGENRQRAHLNMGVSLPTGSIDETFTNHHGNLYHMPYNMQLGSGTFDPIIGATYIAESPVWSWGAQTLNYIRVGKNDEGYRLGNKYTATAWVARNISEFVSLSFRLEGEAWENVSGQDSSLPITTIAGANPDELAGERIMANVGLNLLAGPSLGALKGQRLALEFGVPLHERFSGPQPDSDYRLNIGWQAAF